MGFLVGAGFGHHAFTVQDLEKKFGMPWPDEKIVAIAALFGIALVVISVTGKTGLDVVTNIVCALGGLVTGQGIESKK